MKSCSASLIKVLACQVVHNQRSLEKDYIITGLLAIATASQIISILSDLRGNTPVILIN